MVIDTDCIGSTILPYDHNNNNPLGGSRDMSGRSQINLSVPCRKINYSVPYYWSYPPPPSLMSPSNCKVQISKDHVVYMLIFPLIHCHQKISWFKILQKNDDVLHIILLQSFSYIISLQPFSYLFFCILCFIYLLLNISDSRGLLILTGLLVL